MASSRLTLIERTGMTLLLLIVAAIVAYTAWSNHHEVSPQPLPPAAAQHTPSAPEISHSSSGKSSTPKKAKAAKKSKTAKKGRKSSAPVTRNPLDEPVSPGS